jgi:hypothetical protein
MRRHMTLALVPIAFFSMAAKGQWCATTVEPISGPGAEAGIPSADSGTHPDDAATTGKDAGAACIAAGGFCASGDVTCAAVGPQDCGVSGGFCCLPDVPDAGGSNSGECSEAGGQCLIGSTICAVPGPQSCGGITPAGLYCCLTNVADCGQPDATTYACPAPADGGPSCQGGAQPPVGIPNFEALQQATDEDASYPAGCKATFPGCNNGKVPYCTCSGSGPGNSGWTCFY